MKGPDPAAAGLTLRLSLVRRSTLTVSGCRALASLRLPPTGVTRFPLLASTVDTGHMTRMLCHHG